MIDKELHKKIFPGDGLVNHKEFKKQVDTNGLYSPFVLSLRFGKLQWFGSYNYAPVGFKEISTEEFAQKIFDGFPVIHERRQLFYDNAGNKLDRMIQVDITLYSGDCGYAIERDYWKKTVRYYTFSKCEHKWIHTRNLGYCYNEYTCEICGETNNVDSGD